jgi:hypothetical protein
MWMQWPRFILFLATSDLSGWYNLMHQRCSWILVSVECPVCPCRNNHTCRGCCKCPVFSSWSHS